MHPKIISNLEEHAVAMAQLSALMSCNPRPGSQEEQELELLALAIEDFERRTIPPVQADPVEVILFRMDQMRGRKRIWQAAQLRDRRKHHATAAANC